MNNHNPASLQELPEYLYDGYIVHREVLARGLTALALPRQVMMAGAVQPVPAQVSFTHGAPNASTLSAVTFAQDRRLRRALFERSNVPKPKGASFSWRSFSRAAKWAEKVGYPVNVKETVGENPATVISDVQNKAELRDAFQVLRKREEADRAPGKNPHLSGYATTRLTYTLDEDGNEVAPLRTRMLIEKEISGTVTRAFVIAGKLVAAVELDQTRKTGVADVTATLKPELISIFLDASRAIPGLAASTIDVVTVRPRGLFKKKRYFVTELAERPRISSFVTAAPQLANAIGSALLAHEAEIAQLPLPSPQNSVKRAVSIEGLRHVEEVANNLPAIFEEHGASLEILEADAVMGVISAICSGDVSTIARLMELLMAGLLLEDRASAVEYLRENNDG